MPEIIGWQRDEAKEYKSILKEHHGTFIVHLGAITFSRTDGWGFDLTDAFGETRRVNEQLYGSVVWLLDDWAEEAACELAYFKKYG